MSDYKSTLGDCCQKHSPITAPVVYPYSARLDPGDNLRAEYRCACGNEWSCWWNSASAGWTAEDVHELNLSTARIDTGPVVSEWYHRGPCHRCTACDGRECYVNSDGLNPEVHICAKGCDGIPAGLESAA